MANLVDNAIQYAGPGAHITVRTRRCSNAGANVLEVQDDGPGIAPAQRAVAFTWFTRGAAAGGAGSGLGLAIVRDIANGHGSEVTL